MSVAGKYFNTDNGQYNINPSAVLKTKKLLGYLQYTVSGDSG